MRQFNHIFSVKWKFHEICTFLITNNTNVQIIIRIVRKFAIVYILCFCDILSVLKLCDNYRFTSSNSRKLHNQNVIIEEWLGKPKIGQRHVSSTKEWLSIMMYSNATFPNNQTSHLFQHLLFKYSSLTWRVYLLHFRKFFLF